MSKAVVPPEVLYQMKKALIYRVGYASPPPEHQFKKGQSGNPKCKMPKTLANTQSSTIIADSHAARIVKVLNEDVTIHIQGERKSISKAEAVQRNSEKLAMKGSVLANRDLRQQLLAEDARRKKEVNDDHEPHYLYLQARATALKHATSKGDALTEFWIDPEDMVFRPNQMVRIKGAESVESQPYFEFLENFLKLMIF